jgi:hypothetical protein
MFCHCSLLTVVLGRMPSHQRGVAFQSQFGKRRDDLVRQLVALRGRLGIRERLARDRAIPPAVLQAASRLMLESAAVAKTYDPRAGARR